MSSQLWTAPNSSVALLFVGRLRFEDVTTPIADRDEWGLNTLTRTVKGPAFKLEEYAAGLKQGAEYKGFYLQTWQPIEHPHAPGFTLNYKGVTSGLPNPRIVNSRCDLCSSLYADNLSVKYQGRTIVSATREIKYVAPQTNYRYITNAEPVNASYSGVRGASTVKVSDSSTTVTFSDGTTRTLTGSAPAAVATALAVDVEAFVIGPSATQVFGTPFWECEDCVQLRYPSR